MHPGAKRSSGVTRRKRVYFKVIERTIKKYGPNRSKLDFRMSCTASRSYSALAAVDEVDRPENYRRQSCVVQ